ncbi:hypothetical protein [Salinisphaera hydrothermalis]|uniref:Uncharacterized protein n=1 Tax=Salinisphaera hydrothermalis (strain C41B8) TaxID=1304275 RepID=A0A084INQ3_SALHC|nr:hypothetical protein [Salinisphaera hydrothermalis]KEZ78337.1 hypothetical protein C41B8_05528 [Salinisphaera hydrothermalis C41B8]
MSVYLHGVTRDALDKACAQVALPAWIDIDTPDDESVFNSGLAIAISGFPMAYQGWSESVVIGAFALGLAIWFSPFAHELSDAIRGIL